MSSKKHRSQQTFKLGRYEWTEFPDLLTLPLPFNGLFLLIDRYYRQLGLPPVRRRIWSNKLGSQWFLAANGHSYDVVIGCAVVPAYHIYASRNGREEFILNPFSSLPLCETRTAEMSESLARELCSKLRQQSEVDSDEARIEIDLPEDSTVYRFTLYETLNANIDANEYSFFLIGNSQSTLHIRIGIAGAAGTRRRATLLQKIDQDIGSLRVYL